LALITGLLLGCYTSDSITAAAVAAVLYYCSKIYVWMLLQNVGLIILSDANITINQG